MFKNEIIRDINRGRYPVTYDKFETDKYRHEVLKSLEDFMKNPLLMRGYMVIPTGGGKSFTTALACLKNYRPNEVLYITSKHVILRNIFGLNVDSKFGSLSHYKEWFNIIGDNLCVNDSSQSLFLYNTIKIRYNDGTLDSILNGVKLIVFDEDTYSHTSNNYVVLDYISKNYPSIKLLGVGLFDYRPMDGVSLTHFFKHCVYSINKEELVQRGILPKINYINAVQSSKVLYEAFKDKINPRTGRNYTLVDCRRLINYNGIGQQNVKMLNDVLSKIAVKEKWLDSDRCIHIMSVSSNIKLIEFHKKKIKELFLDVYGVDENNIEFLDYHSFMSDSEKEDNLVKYNRNDGAKFKILCGVSAFSEGLHTSVFTDAMICHRNAKAEYFISQLTGRLAHQCFTRRPYFIDVACDIDSVEIKLSNSSGLLSGCGYKYNDLDDLSIFDFDFDIDFNEDKCSYFLPEDRLKLVSVLRKSHGLVNNDNLISRLSIHFPNTDDKVLFNEIESLCV